MNASGSLCFNAYAERQLIHPARPSVRARIVIPSRAIMRVWPGQPYPLGATWTGLGANFAIFSAHAAKVELCLFDSADAAAPTTCVALPEYTDMVWHGFLPDVRPTAGTRRLSSYQSV